MQLRNYISASTWEKSFYHIGNQKKFSAPAQNRNLARAFAVRRHVVASGKNKSMPIAQTGDCACEFEWLKTEKP